VTAPVHSGLAARWGTLDAVRERIHVRQYIMRAFTPQLQ